jgi:hypothetical protein
MFTRLGKINVFKELVDHWNEFKTLYSNDIILKKIGIEILDGKMDFDDKILSSIKEYPNKKQVLYYFNKNQTIEMPKVTGLDCDKFKEIILKDVGAEAKIHLDNKNELLKSLIIISNDKSTNNLNYLVSLENGTTPAGKTNTAWHETIGKIKENVKLGNFVVEKKGSQMIIELPIGGIKPDLSKSETLLLNIDTENPLKYSLEIGNLKTPKMNIEDRIKKMRSNSENTLSRSLKPNM